MFYGEIKMVQNTGIQIGVIPSWPAKAYGEDNSEAYARVRLDAVDKALLREKLRLSRKKSQALLAANKRKSIRSPEDLQKIRGLHIQRSALHGRENVDRRAGKTLDLKCKRQICFLIQIPAQFDCLRQMLQGL
jgi:hypothetical protein